MKNDMTMIQPACEFRGDQENGINTCETCGARTCGCCVGLCEGCGDLVCAGCADPGPPLDPGCPRCVRSATPEHA